MSKFVLTLFDDLWCFLTWPLFAGPFCGPLTYHNVFGNGRSGHAWTTSCQRWSAVEVLASKLCAGHCQRAQYCRWYRPSWSTVVRKRPNVYFFHHSLERLIVMPLWPTTHKTQKKAKMIQWGCKNVALKLAQISLRKGYFGQFKGYILCSGNVGGFFASEGWKLLQGLYNRSTKPFLLQF